MKPLCHENDRFKKTSVYIGVTIVAMIAAMIPAMAALGPITNNMQAADAADAMDKPYVKAFANSALYEPNAGKTRQDQCLWTWRYLPVL
jgi:hypothetical protein